MSTQALQQQGATISATTADFTQSAMSTQPAISALLLNPATTDETAEASEHPQRRSRLKSPTLEAVLAYQHRDVVYRFQKTYGVSQAEAEDIFEQVKKWLWLANVRRQQGITEGLNIDHPLVVIDEMWHNFVLFTKEYAAFCQHFFGYYIHHAPATEAEETQYRTSLQQRKKSEVRSLKMAMKRPQYEYIYDHLGKETFVKWYIEYPRKYSFRQLAEMHLKALDDMVLIVPPAESTVPGNNHPQKESTK